jgi:hypothetical protein
MALDLQLGKATGIVFKTAPYLLYRTAVYGALFLVMALALLFVALIGWAFGTTAACVMFIILLVAGGAAMRFIKEYVLYLLKAGHIAVVTELIVRGALPQGTSQTQWGKQRVMHYFKEISVLSLVDALVRGVVNVVNSTLFNVINILPVPGVEWAAKIAQSIVHFSLTYIDESVIAYTFKTGNENVFDAAKSGIIIYCQSWKCLLRNAVALTILGYAFTIVCTAVFLIPLGAVALLLPSTWGLTKFLLFVLALALGVSVKWILFDPIACTSTILTFLKEAEVQAPDPTWESRIEAVSDKFRELKQKAAEKFKGSPAANGPSASAAPAE